MDSKAILKELSDHFNKKVTFDMTAKIKPFELKHLKTVKSSLSKPDPKDEKNLIINTFRVLELDDEVIVREITEIKIQK